MGERRSGLLHQSAVAKSLQLKKGLTDRPRKEKKERIVPRYKKKRRGRGGVGEEVFMVQKHPNGLWGVSDPKKRRVTTPAV